MSKFLTGIDHIQIAAPTGSEDAARKFYGELLGMEEIPKPENLKGTRRMLVPLWLTRSAYRYTADFMPAKKAHPGFTVNALEQLKFG